MGRNYLNVGVVLALFLICGCFRGEGRGPEAVDGVLDLSKHRYAEAGPARLQGMWRHVDGVLAAPGDLALVRGTPAQFPALWRGQVSKKAASYLLTVNPGELGHRGAILIETPLSVERVFVNGEEVGRSGVPGLSAETERPMRHSVLACFPYQGGPLDIVLQVSNFANVTGGLNTAIWLGPEDGISLIRKRSGVMASAFGGAFLLLALFHGAFFLIRRIHRVNLYFALYCLMWSLSTLFGNVGGCLMDALFPALPWRLTIDMALVSVGLLTPLLVMFYHQIYPWRFSRWVDALYLGLGLGYGGWLLLAEPQAFGSVPKAYILISFSQIPYFAWRFVCDIRAGRQGIGLLIPGYLVLGFSTASELFFDFHLVQGRVISLVSAFLFIAPYSFFIAHRISRIYARVDALSDELARRRETEEMLKQTQGRLAGMLNRLSMPLFAINESFEICFTNEAFESVSGDETKALLGRYWLDLLAPDCQKRMAGEMASWFEKASEGVCDVGQLRFVPLHGDASSYHAHVLPMDLDDEHLALVVLADAGGLVEARRWVGSLNHQQERFQLVFDALEAMGEVSESEAEAICSPKEMESLEAMAKGIRLRMTGEGKGNLREVAAEVMTLSLELWVLCTGTTKVELARESGLWKVYTDKDGWDRTQTLDKYLKLESFPQRPRLAQVVRTAEFVLTFCHQIKESGGQKERLAGALARLKEAQSPGRAA